MRTSAAHPTFNHEREFATRDTGRTQCQATSSVYALKRKHTDRPPITDIPKRDPLEYKHPLTRHSTRFRLPFYTNQPTRDAMSAYTNANLRHEIMFSIYPSLLDTISSYQTALHVYEFLCAQALPPADIFAMT